MKIIGIIVLLFSANASASYDYYVKIGAGYKVHQTDHVFDNDTGERRNLDFNDPLSARIEFGVEHGNVSYGVSHHSNWLTGYPFNDEGEFQKTELFVDYKWIW